MLPKTRAVLISYILASIPWMLGTAVARSWAAAPVLYFSDITSGPRSGNGDTSGGQVSGQNGAIVTVWGVNLGSDQGTSKIYCNGAEAVHYYTWGNATGPSNLSKFHQMQVVSFAVSGQSTEGNGTIYAIVNGVKSNALKFTVRDGNIYFVSTKGNDSSGTGSWSKPWRTIPGGVRNLVAGDILYVGNGVNQTTETDYSACVNLGRDGTKTEPIAVIVYPGATSRVGSNTLERAFFNYSWDDNAYTTYWVVSRFTITTRSIGVATGRGCRVIGNYITAPQGDGMDGAINIEGSDVFALGNELYKVGRSSCSKLYHGIYGKGVRLDDPPRAPTETNREIAWNYIHDCQCNRAINIYNEQPYAAFLEKHRVHDNVIVNQHGDGIMLGYYVTGKNWIYNNLIVKAGMGPEWPDDASYHTGIRINAGHEDRRTAQIYCYQNTLYGCGWAGAADPASSGHLLVSPEAISTGTRVDFKNNIVYSTGEPYMASESVSLPSGAYRNAWFGDGGAPSWDTSAINSDPRFVSTAGSDFRLQTGSPCRDSGSKLAPAVRDLLGIVRPQGSGVDLGVYESTAAAPVGAGSNR